MSDTVAKEETKKGEGTEQVVQSLCRMCDDRCAINVYLRNGEIVDIMDLKTIHGTAGASA